MQDLLSQKPINMKVIGIGGAGNNAINLIISEKEN